MAKTKPRRDPCIAVLKKLAAKIKRGK